MPVIPAIGAGLAALGGGSAAVGAGIASAAIGGVTSMVGSSNAAKAYNQAGQLQYQASQDAIASQERMYEQTRADNEWARQIGMGAGSALTSAFGLQTPSMTGGSASSGGYDVAAYLQANPDVAAARQQIMASGNVGPGKQWSSFEDWVVNEQIPNAQRAGEDRLYPTVQAQPQTSGGGYQPAAGYIDPTATDGYTMAPRSQMAPLDVSIDSFRASPDYEFRFSEGQKALDHVASANRGLMSGQRMKAAQRYGQNLADAEYTDWRDYTTNQYNNDRNYNEAVYQSDRSRLDSRYDQRNNTLLQLAGFGSAANAANQNAAQSFANNSANLTMTGAQAQGNAAANAASAWNQGLGNIMTGLTNIGGQIWGANGQGSTPPINPGYINGYNPSWIAS